MPGLPALALTGAAAVESATAVELREGDLQAVASRAHAVIAAQVIFIRNATYWLALMDIGTTIFPQCIASTAESASTIGK